jgi:hypothetical protein
MLSKALAATALSLVSCAVGSAQVIYEPVTSQYRIGDETFYYGGSNPRVFAYAEQRLGCFQDGHYTREGRAGVGYLHRNLIGRPDQTTFSDCRPYENAIVYGYTSVDARNDANANVPRYFRMADLLAAAVPAADGVGYVVPAMAPGTITIRTVRHAAPPATNPATNPATQPRPVLIFPKKLLDQPAATDKIVTLAR